MLLSESENMPEWKKKNVLTFSVECQHVFYFRLHVSYFPACMSPSTYDGTGKFPGHFRKSITLRTNAKKEIIRLYVEGDMQAGK